MRNIRDVLLKVTKACPAAGAANASTAIDLGAVTPGVTLDQVEVEVAIPALANLADAKLLTVTLKDSADNSSFAAIAPLATLVSTGAGGAGAAAQTRLYRLPSTTRRYLRIDLAVDASGGDNTASSVSLSLLV